MKTEPKTKWKIPEQQKHVPKEGWFYVYRAKPVPGWVELMGSSRYIDTKHLEDWCSEESERAKQLIAINLSTGDLYQFNMDFREVVHITSRPAWRRVVRIVEQRKRRRET